MTARNVRAVVVGGYAVAFHGRPRFTKDIDILIDQSPNNIASVMSALHDFGFGGLGLSAADLTPGRPQDLADIDALGPAEPTSGLQ